MTEMHDDPLNVLLVEDNEDDFLIVRDLLRGVYAERLTLEWVETYEGGLDAIRAQRHDLILLDFRLSHRTGLELLEETRSVSPRAPVILMTGQGDHDIDVQAMQAGAMDYLVKDRLDADSLERAIRYAVERRESAEALRASEDRYRTFVENSTEGIWRFELKQPMPTDLPEEEQIAHLKRYAYLAECNEAMARLYGYERASDVIGSRFGDFLSTGEGGDNNYLRRLIHTQYRLVNAEAFEMDRHGQPKYVLHNLIGVVENGLLYRIWGAQNDITERKRAELAQAQLAAIVETSADAIISTTLDGLIATWNKGAEALFGYTAQEVTGQPISCVVPADRSQEVGRILDYMRRGERVAAFDTVQLHKDGRHLDVSLAVSPMLDVFGHVTGSSAIARDITEQKRAEMLLRRSEANMAAAQRVAHFGSWELELGNPADISLNPLHCSEETFRIFGYEPVRAPVTTELFFRGVPPEDQSVIQQAVAAAVSRRQNYSLVHRVRRPDGEERIVRETGQVFEGEADGEAPRLVGTVHDVTEQQRMEEHIRFNALLLSQVRNAVIATDLAGRITYWNNFAEILYQWKADEVIGKQVTEVTISPSQSRKAADEIMRQVQEAGHWEGEVLVQRKDGSTFPAHVVDTLILDASGIATGVVGVSIDITERKQAEDALRQQDMIVRIANKVTRTGGWTLDLSDQRLFWSDEIFDLLEYPHGAVPPLAEALALYPDPWREKITVAIKRCAEDGVPFDIEVELLTGKGKKLWVRVCAEAERHADGSIKRVQGAFQDITERKQAEEKLDRTSREILTVWESMTDAFFVVDPQWQITNVNSQAALLLQRSREALLGTSLWDAFPDAVGTLFDREYHRVLEEQVSVSFEEFYTPLGKWFDVRAYPSACGVSVYFRDITDRKDAEAQRLQVEEALRTSEQRLRLTLESGRFGTFDLDLLTGLYHEISDVGRAQFALPTEGAISMGDFFQRVHPEDLVEMQATVARAASAREADFDSDYRIVLPEGDVRWISVHGTLIFEDTGLPIRMLGVTQDITTRKEAEDERDRIESALRQSEQRFRSVVEKVESLVIHDQEGRLIDVNQNACDSLGYTREELLRLRVPDYELGYEQAGIARMWEQMASGEISTLVVDGLHQRKNGSTFPVEVRVGLMEADGRPLMVAVARDVTDRKQAEEERDRFFTLSLDMLAIIGSDGYIKRLNPAFEATLGYSDAELMARPFLEFVHPDDIPATLAQMANLDGGNQGIGFENRYICRDGSYKWMRWTTAPYGSLWYTVAHDVTAIKQAEAALHQANDELELRVAERTTQLENSHLEMSIAKEEAERANAAKSDFLSRMSHELRTPMNSILGFAQLMEMDAPEGKQAVRLGHVLRAGQHLLQLINEVLDLARVESEHLQLSTEPVSLGTCAQNAVDMIRPLCDQRDQRIICDWPEAEPLYAHADQQRLIQVLINLLSNATKYNRDGGVIRVRCEQAGEDRQRISISDSGMGMTAEQIAKLFQPFERLGAESSSIEGTGLGLALSKRLVELMAGTLSVESDVGVGSTFTVDLPRADSRRPETETALPPHASPDADARQYDLLHIEDNPANLQLIEHMLSVRPQYRLRSAQTGLSGLSMARERPPSLILLDLHLPDLPGNEVLIRLQADPSTRDIPVVIVSADATLGQIRRLLAAGATKYLTKPLDVRHFLEVLHEILQAEGRKNG